MRRNTPYVRIAILAFVALLITLPLFLSKNLFASQDILFHLTWSQQFYNAIADGVFYPRWVDTPFGYGSPIFIFYAPLSFYIISAIHWFIDSYIISIKIAIYLSFLLCGISMYFFCKSINGESAALTSAVIYQLTPYHTFDLFARGVLPELFAFVWFPLILLFLRKIFLDRNPVTVALLSLAYAGLITTHLVSSFMFTFVMTGYGLYLSIFEKKNGLLRALFAMVLGLSLSSIYLLPVILERPFIHIKFIEFFHYKDCFLFLTNTLMNREFYSMLHAIFILESAFFIFSLLLIKKKLIDMKNAFFVLLLPISLFLTVPLSSFIWKHIPEFSNLQFPWRWLMFSGFSVAVLSGNLIKNHQQEIRKAAYIFCLPLVILSFVNIMQITFFTKEEVNHWTKESALYAPIEYRPIWLQHHRKKLRPGEKVSIEHGRGTVEVLEWKAHNRRLLSEGETDLTLRFTTFYFPGWRAYIDNTQTSIEIEKDTGAMLIRAPRGMHNLELRFLDTPIRYYSKLISLISVSVVVFVLFVAGGQKMRNGRSDKEI